MIFKLIKLLLKILFSIISAILVIFGICFLINTASEWTAMADANGIEGFLSYLWNTMKSSFNTLINSIF